MRDYKADETPTPEKGLGQSLIEYALILALLGLAFGFALAATGPVLGNVFSNVVFQVLRETPEGAGQAIGGPVDFWLTVTYVHENPQLEQALPTRTPAPPSTTPTAGPSPTPTPVTPTRTPIPSNTPRPTPTPLDITRVAPYLDEVNEPQNWRVGATAFLGSDDWCGQYYVGTNLDRLGAQPILRCNREFGPQFRGNLDFNWGPLGPLNQWPGGVGNESQWYNNFSVRYSRSIYVPPDNGPLTVQFNATYDDGIRVWIDYAPGCAGSVVSGGAPSGVNTYTTGCLVIDDWNSGATRTRSVTRTLNPGTYTMRVEYMEVAGDANITFNWGIASNVDDTQVDNNGVPRTGPADCNWGRRRGDDANSVEWMWDEYAGGDFRENMRCHLEFRGYVYIPGPGDEANGWTPMSRPELVYWDIWDMQSNRQQGWLEIAEYVEESPGVANRAAMTWQRVNLRQGNSTNYNWTRNVVDLTNVGGVSYVGKRVAFRFVMENRNSTNVRRWYIDDIEFRDANLREFRVGNLWDLSTNEQREDFITSPGWSLTTTNAANGVCCSWEDSTGPGVTYRRFSEAPDSTTNRGVMRIHYVELNGWVDVSGNTPDREGDTGEPLLSFYMAYVLGRFTGVEVQYSTSPYGIGPANWQVVPGIDPAMPYGMLRNLTENADVTRTSLEFTEVSLAEIPATRFRLRFAMLVRNAANLRDGMWIDNIYIERRGRPLYLDYPFYDNAEAGLGNWLPSGQWWRTTEAAWDGDHSFTDSPGGNYLVNTNSTLRLLYPIDLNNDTPDNRTLTDRNTAGGNSNPAAPGTIAPPAVNPVLTFWHRRSLAANDNLHVEWRRQNESDANWKPLWSYVYRMGTRSTDNSTRTAIQLAWERVEIDLTAITRTFTGPAGVGDLEDDDILIRFRLQSDASSTSDGVYIDGIEIKNRQDLVHRLWPSGENRVIAGQARGNGNGATYSDDVDNFDWWTRWHLGGWNMIEWEQRNGLRAFHESATGQTHAPATPIIEVTPGNPPTYNFITAGSQAGIYHGGNEVFTPHQTFNVLEMRTIIDLTATDVSEKPTLYFWHRYHTGTTDRISVQISTELNLTGAALQTQMENWCRGGSRPTCYEHNWGWSEWQEVWFRGQNLRAYGWQREQISLTPYASANTGSPGQRIRVRFVFDALEGTPNRDGWYIDDISIRPLRDNVIRRIADQAFFDGARNLQNWTTEGIWGLSPDFFRGAGGGPASLGAWQEYWFNCNTCANLAPGSTPSAQRFAVGTDIFLDTTPNSSANATRTILDINYDMGNGAPRPGVFNFTDRFVGRWVLDTPVVGTGGVQAGDYSFIAYSDDGVRMKYDEIDAAGNIIDPRPRFNDILEWNIIYNWSDKSARPEYGTARLENGKRYRITLEYYENTGGATMILNVGGNSFSFTDSPKQGAGPAFPDIPAIPYANTSLILNGTLDLEDTTNPILQYYTYYELRGTARVEISIDGGFSWTNTGFQDTITYAGGGTDSNFQTPNYSGQWMPANGDWELRRHNLTRYAGRQIMIRFRLDRQGDTCLNNDNGCTPGSATFNANGRWVSWWVVDIRVAE